MSCVNAHSICKIRFYLTAPWIDNSRLIMLMYFMTSSNKSFEAPIISLWTCTCSNIYFFLSICNLHQISPSYI